MRLYPPPGMGELSRYAVMHRQYQMSRKIGGFGDDTAPALPVGPTLTPDMLPALPGMDMTQTGQVSGTIKSAMIAAAAETAVAQTVVSVGTDIAVTAGETAAAAATAAGAAALAAGASASSAAMAAGSVIPIIGWALDVLIVIGELIASAAAKRQTKKLIEDAKKQIQAYGDQTMATVQAQQMAIGQQVFPAAQQLAASGQALNGLDGLFGITKESITRAIAHLQVESVKLVGDAILKTGAIGAKLVGDKRGEALAEKKQRIWDANSARVQQLFDGKLQNPYKMFSRDLDAVGRTLGDEQGVHVVRQKCRDLIAAAKRDMDAYKAKTLATMATADYRQALTVNIAKALRGDPTYLAQVAQLDAQNKMLDNTMNSLQHTSSVSTGSGGLLASAAGLLGAFLLFKP